MKSGSRDASRSIRMYLSIKLYRLVVRPGHSPFFSAYYVSQVLDASGGLGREELEGAEVELRILRRLRLLFWMGSG